MKLQYICALQLFKLCLKSSYSITNMHNILNEWSYELAIVVCYVLLFCVFRAVLSVCFSTGHIVMVPLNLTCLHCLQHFFSEHLSSLY